MKKLNILKSLLLLMIIIVVSDNAIGQTKRRRTTRETAKEEKETYTRTLGESLNTEIKIGNLSFNGGFGIAMKGNVGYKFNDRFSAGLGTKFEYNFINVSFGDDFSVFNYGGLAYGRAKLFGPVYAQAEYNTYHYDAKYGFANQNVNYPAFGLGYMQNDGGTWAYGIELLFIASEQARDYSSSTIEYWLSFSHRF